MIRVRVSNSLKAMKQDCIDYLIKNKLYKITGNIIRLVIDSDGEMVLFMTKDTYVKWCKGNKQNREQIRRRVMKTVVIKVDNGVTISREELEVIETPWGDRIRYDGVMYAIPKDGYLEV